MPFALDSTGLQTQTQDEIVEGILARLQSKFGGTLNTGITSLSGQFAAVVGELLAAFQQAALDVNASFDPNGAEGVQLDQRAALTGSVRKGPIASTVEGVLTATGACVVADGTLIRNTVYGTTWQTTGGPYVFGGAGTLAATIEAIEAGPLVAQAGDTWAAVTVIANLAGFTNPANDATAGRLVEGDPAFRYRRTVELFARGNGPLATVSAVVGRVPGVVSVRTYHNPSESPVGTDPNRNLGIPFKAANVVVETDPATPGSALRQAILNACWSAGGAGVEFFGTSYSGTVIDVEGQSQPVAFDVVTLVDVYLRITVTTSALGGGDGPVVPLDPAIMATLLRSTCVTKAQTSYTIAGRDFRAFDYYGAITVLGASGQVSGIDALVVEVSADGSTWLGSFVPITMRQKIDFDTPECTVIIDGVTYLP